MNKDFDIDSILADFYADEEKGRKEKSAPKLDVFDSEPKKKRVNVSADEFNLEDIPSVQRKPEYAEPRYTEPEYAEPEYAESDEDLYEDEIPDTEEVSDEGGTSKKGIFGKSGKSRSAGKDAEKAASRRREKREPREVPEMRRAPFIVKPLMLVLSILCLGWSVTHIVPAAGSAAAVKVPRPTPTASVGTNTPQNATETPDGSNQTPADPNAEPTPIPEPTETPKPHYTIEWGATYGPTPKASNFGTVSIDNAAQVMDVIQQARDCGLLEGQDVVFNPDIDFYYDSTIQYYMDETILTICWKQVIDGFTCSFVETKIADASQFRRKLADDYFGAANTYYATDIARSANSVVAMNADYYLFRDFGMVVYDSELYRFNTGNYTGSYSKYNCVDTCFVDANGDFIFKKVLEQQTEEEARQFIEDNRIQFSIAFGPVLVENGEATVTDWYPIGEIDKGYSRAGIGQYDSLHYLYMSLNHSPEQAARWTINQFAQHFADTGVKNAYCLDGGQTSEIVFQGEPFNYIDYGAERLVSDIIYFATAIPEGE